MIAAIFALIGRPLVKQLERIRLGKFHLPNWLNVIITMLAFIGLTSGILRILLPLIGAEAERLQQVDISGLISGSEVTLADWKTRLDELNINYENLLSTEQMYAYIQDLFEAVSFSSFANSLLGAFGNIFIATFSVLFITFFLLKERQIMHNMYRPEKR